MAELEWAKIALEMAVSFGSAVGGLFIGVWKWGRSSAKQEQSTKDDYAMKISALREEMRLSIATHASEIDDKGDLLTSQFKESFDGIRRQIDDHKLTTEQHFMRKEDFRDFRDEYREDTREIKASIAELAKRL